MSFCLLYKRKETLNFCISVSTQTQWLTRDLLTVWFPGDVQATLK